MRYIPHTEEEIASMLKEVGLQNLEDLFSTVPENCRREGDLKLPKGLTEWELNREMEGLAAQVAGGPGYKVFLGAGSYRHFIPAILPYLLGRSEFLTAYTPYQPEVSQGTLQAIFEYQTLVSRLLGMETANASMYDGASALAEALLMAIRINRKRRVAVSGAVHPHYRRVVETYFRPTGFEVITLPQLEDGRTDLSGLRGLDDLSAVAVQSPNFFGCVEDLPMVGSICREREALFLTCFTEPLAYGLLKNPGCQGADIACGEGQSLGIPPSFGGPGLGIFASRQKYVRNMPGRLVGETRDMDGKRGFVLTLATREQHIRREKATSNICSNQGLCATASAMYLATLGGTGLAELSRLNYDKSEYLKGGLRRAGFAIPFEAPTFNEFVVQFPEGFERTYKRLLSEKIVAGLPLEPYYPRLRDHYLLCATETTSKEEMDALIEGVTS